MLVEWLSLALFLLYFLGQTAWGLTAYRRIVDAILAGRMKRTELYLRLMAGLWLPVVIVLLLTVFGQFDFSDIGLGFRQFAVAPWVRIAAYVLSGLYFLYLVISLIGLRQNARKGLGSKQRIPEKTRALYPVSRREKRVWAAAAVNAGVCEELLFRGFLTYLLCALFPALPLFAVLVASALLFGAGHLYQGAAEAAKPALFGLLFGVIYVSYGTLLPCVLLHAMQDWCAIYGVNESN